MEQPSERDLRRARELFRQMLEEPTREAHWQRFFSENPFVLSMSLPLRLTPDEILPLGRPGRSEPDFVFFPRDKQPIPSYGVIELKRPDSAIIRIPRKNVAALSPDAETAIQQARAYTRNLAAYLPPEVRTAPLFLGSRAHMFVIMGLSSELTTRISLEIFRDLVEERLPPNLQLITYDVLLRSFESHLPRTVHVLVAAVPERDAVRNMLLARVNSIWEQLDRAATDYARNAEAYRRSAHGISPDWLIGAYLPQKWRNVDLLREQIKVGLDKLPDNELEELSGLLATALTGVARR